MRKFHFIMVSGVFGIGNFILRFRYCISFRKGQNGIECIKRAICKSAQLERFDAKKSQEPGSFISELVRVIFRCVYFIVDEINFKIVKNLPI